jgi:hypothetical protein
MSKRARGVKKGVHNIAFSFYIIFPTLHQVTELLTQSQKHSATLIHHNFTDLITL